MPAYLAEFVPTLLNETESVLNGLLPASKAEVSAKAAKEDERIARLEFRLEHIEVSSMNHLLCPNTLKCTSSLTPASKWTATCTAPIALKALNG